MALRSRSKGAVFPSGFKSVHGCLYPRPESKVKWDLEISGTRWGKREQATPDRLFAGKPAEDGFLTKTDHLLVHRFALWILNGQTIELSAAVHKHLFLTRRRIECRENTRECRDGNKGAGNGQSLDIQALINTLGALAGIE